MPWFGTKDSRDERQELKVESLRDMGFRLQSDSKPAPGELTRYFLPPLRLTFCEVAKALSLIVISPVSNVRGHMVPFPRERLRLHPKCCVGGSGHRPGCDGYSAAFCARPRHALDHHPLLFCPARQRSRNCRLSPSLLLG